MSREDEEDGGWGKRSKGEGKGIRKKIDKGDVWFVGICAVRELDGDNIKGRWAKRRRNI